MGHEFTQPVVSPSANGGTGGTGAINTRNAINAQASALAKVGGRRRRTKKRGHTSKKRRLNRKRSTKRSAKKRHYRLFGGGTNAPYVKGPSGETANKIAIAQMAGAENAKNDGK